jgi:hypothetical protein
MEHKFHSFVLIFYEVFLFYPIHPKLEGNKNERKRWNEIE